MQTHVCLLMCINKHEDMWKAQIYSYRERFRRLDRKWHALIGSQLLFGLMVLRFRNTKGDGQIQNTTTTTTPPLSNEDTKS